MKSSRLLAIAAAASAVLYTFPASAGLVFDRAAFEAAIDGDMIDGFEGIAANATSPVVLFAATSNSATLTSLFGTVLEGAGSPPVADGAPGRFATDGAKWWDSAADFTITFTTAVEAFGIDITDLGDFENSDNCTGQLACSGLTVQFLNNNGDVIGTATPAGASSEGTSRPADFVGYYADGAEIKSIKFINASSGFDGVGYDKVTIGSVPSGNPTQVPEPSTLLLGAASLGLLLRRARRVAVG